MTFFWPAVLLVSVTAGLFCQIPRVITLSGKPVTIEAPLPETARAGNLVLVVNRVLVKPQQGAILRIFAGMPEANRSTSVDDEHFLGTITVLAHGGPGNKAGSNMTLNVPTAAQRLLKSRRIVRVTIIPMSDNEVTIGSVRIALASE